MKILNRGLVIAGEKRKVGTPVITVVTSDSASMVTRAYGSSLPTDADKGYAVGCLFAMTTGVVGATLYVNEGSATSCDFNVVNGSGSGASTWNQLYANSQTLAISGTTMTFDGQHASNDGFTVTMSGAGSGDAIQITNVGTGKDINGTSSTWSVSKTGVAVFLSETLSGTGGATVQTITAGDVVWSDGSLAITDADNAATFSVTNNTATTASVFVLAGSGVFTGSTTSSFLTLTPSGLTSGTALYLPVAGLDTGRAVHIVANALTSGIVFNVTSSATAIATTGRLFLSTHSGATGTSAILNEFISAANDETVILQVTGSSALAAGAAFRVSMASMTTGTAIDVPDLAVLTTGVGISVVSSATAITGAGRLFFSNHTGATGTSAILNEFKSAATDETIVVQVTTAAMINGVALKVVGTTGMTSGSALLVTSSTAGAVITNGIISFTSTGAFTSNAATDGGFVEIKANSTTAGTILNLTGTALTTGIGVQLSNSTSAITTGSLLRVTTSGTGTIATNGIVSITHAGIFLSTSNAGVLDVRASALVGAGTLVNFMTTAASQTASTVLNVENSGFTTGYAGTMLRVKSPTTTGAAILLSIIGDGITSGGTGMKISTTALTTGTGLLVTASGGTAAITTGSLLSVTTDGTGAIATNGIVSFTHTGIFTSNSAIDGGFVEIKTAATTAGTAVNIVTAALTTGVALNISSSTANMTTGSLLRVANGGTGAIATNGIVSFTHTGVFTSTSAINGGFVEIKANSTTAGTIVNIVGSGLITGIALEVSNGTAAMTSGSLIRGAAGGTGAVATNGIYSFFHTGVYTSAAATLGMFHIAASATTAGTVASITSGTATTGIILSLSATAATLTTGRYLSANDLTTEVFGIGTNGHLISTQTTAPTIAVTVQNGITAAAITAGGTDTCGVITTTGTNNNGGSTTITITFNKTYTTAPKTVFLTGANQAGQKASSSAGATLYGGAYISSITATTFVVTIPADSAAGATPSFYYFVIA